MSISVSSVFFCPSVVMYFWRGVPRQAAARVQKPFCMCDGGSRVQKFGWLKHGRLSVLFAGRPDEGNQPDPLLQRLHAS
jgi:hypothetical protein